MGRFLPCVAVQVVRGDSKWLISIGKVQVVVTNYALLSPGLPPPAAYSIRRLRMGRSSRDAALLVACAVA